MKLQCQLMEALCLLALVHLEDFKYVSVCWKSSMASSRQSKSLLDCMEDDFFSKVIDSLTRER